MEEGKAEFVPIEEYLAEEGRKLKKLPRKQKVKRGKAKIYGHRLREVMEQKGICDLELADEIQSNAPHVHRILKNERLCLSLPIAMKIAKVLQTPIEELFFMSKQDADKYQKQQKQTVKDKKVITALNKALDKK